MIALLEWPLHNVAGIVFGFLPLAVWLTLVFGRDFFWLLRERDGDERPSAAHWPSVVAVVPARDEADIIARSLGSLIAQNYNGDFHIILVDDQSDDGTAMLRAGAWARSRRRRAGRWPGVRLAGPANLWAMAPGRSGRRRAQPRLFCSTPTPRSPTRPDNLSRLAARGERDGLVLTSQMAR